MLVPEILVNQIKYLYFAILQCRLTMDSKMLGSDSAYSSLLVYVIL